MSVPGAVVESTDLSGALEAVLFTLNRPVTMLELRDILQAGIHDVEAAVATLAQRLEGRGLMLQRHQDQVQLVTDPAQADVVRRVLRPEYPARLSPAAYETLAIIAYRQPLTRARIEEIRGVNCEAVLENLEEKELIAEVGRLEAPGTPRLFGTTMRFLQILGLRSLDELPPLSSAHADSGS
ncbi:MAG TPA: SMC-Scp complex subunit ScpB [Candidatus Limnocylindrales bacterium]|nr:SMC-Scp complex subunit ScpB [Candidatus Limnocylindrales bacterium]